MKQQNQKFKIQLLLFGVTALVLTMCVVNAKATTVIYPTNFEFVPMSLSTFIPSVNVASYAEMLNQINNNNTIELVLTNDIIVPNDTALTIDAGKNITIELNGHSLSGRSTLSENSRLLNNNGELTIKDNTDKNKDGTGTGVISFFAENPDDDPSPSYASNLLNNYGLFTLESGQVINETSNTSARAANTLQNMSSALRDSEIIINGGRVTSRVAVAIRLLESHNGYENKLIINGGKVRGVVGVQLQVTNARPKATIIINDGEIIGDDRVFYIYDGSQQVNDVKVEVNGGKFIGFVPVYIYTAFGKVTINDGDFEGNYAYSLYYYDAHTSASPEELTNGKITINGGNFSAMMTIESTPLYLYNNYGEVEINGGTFTGDYPIYYYAVYDAGKTTTTINGGTFNGDNIFYAGYIYDPDIMSTSYVIINDGNFNGDIWMYGYNGGGWFFDRNVQFVNGGHFMKKDGMFWPLYIPADKHISDTPPYIFGFEVTLNSNYEGGAEQKLVTESTGQLSRLMPLSRDGYEFVGWNTEADGSGTTVTEESVVSGDTTIYAQWKEIVIPPEPVPTPDDPVVPSTGGVSIIDNLMSHSNVLICLMVLCSFGVVVLLGWTVFLIKRK